MTAHEKTFKAPSFKAVAAAALAQSHALLARWLPGGVSHGAEYTALNPNRPDNAVGSFRVNTTTGAWSDFATGDKGGDFVSLYAYLHGSPNQGAACSALAEEIGVSDAGFEKGAAPQKEKVALSEQIAPVPANAPPIPEKKATAHWDYLDSEGRLLCRVNRMTNPDGGKYYLPQTLWKNKATGLLFWDKKGLEGPRPLYGLDRLAARPDAPVIICEGEKAADAAGRLLPDFVVVTSMNGAKSPTKADWTPLKGRAVIIWPDNDRAGTDYADTVEGLLNPIAASIKIAPPIESAAQGYDAADAEEDGWDTEKALAYIGGAREKEARQKENSQGDSVPESEPDEAIDDDPFPPESSRPAFVVIDDWVQRESGAKVRPGTYFCYTELPKHASQEPFPVNQWFAGPLHIEAQTYDGQANNFGRILRFKTTHKKWRTWAMPMEMLKGNSEDLRGELLSMGLTFDPEYGRRLLTKYLFWRVPKKSIRCALQIGWSGSSFVLPDCVIGPEKDKIIFQSGERGFEEHTVTGSVTEWRTAISERAVGNPNLIIALCAAFAGPLLKLTHSDGGGIHFVGDSSTGKTTLIEAACSVWGGESYRRSWRATANGMEGAAVLFNDCLLALDEISECDPREVGAIVYAIGNGRGKQRASKTGQARAVAAWRCFVLSSGERSVSTQMADGGHRAKAGQSVRLLDIPVIGAWGAWDALHGEHGGAELSDAIKTAVTTFHGAVGRAFLERLTITPIFELAKGFAALKTLPALAAPEFDGQERRAAARFALLALAGELATEFGLTGWPPNAAIEAAVMSFQRWREFRRGATGGNATGNAERHQIAERITAFLERHGDSRFSDLRADNDNPVRDRAGWWRADSGNREYLFTSEGMREALRGFDFQSALDHLQALGAISEGNAKGVRSQSVRVADRKIRLYAVNPSRLEPEIR